MLPLKLLLVTSTERSDYMYRAPMPMLRASMYSAEAPATTIDPSTSPMRALIPATLAETFQRGFGKQGRAAATPRWHS